MMNFTVLERVEKIVWDYINLSRGKVQPEEQFLAALYVLYGYHKQYLKCDSYNDYSPLDMERKDDISSQLSFYASAVTKPYDRLFNYLCRELSSVDYGEFEKIYPTLLINLYTKCTLASGKYSGVAITPDEINSLIAYFINRENCTSVYDPFCGVASILPKLKCAFIGQEINQRTALLARLVVDALGRNDSSLYTGDSLTEWQNACVDAVVSCPPINQRIPKDVLYEAEDSVFVYEMMLKRAFEVNNAKLAVVFEGAGVCFRGGSENQFRSYIVNNNLLDTVISLPANILYGTSISCVLLVCKKDRAKNAPITLVCGENYFVINDERKRILDVKRLLEVLESGNSEDIVKVTIDDIVNEDYNISPSIYQKEPVDCPEGHVLSRLGEIVEMPKSAIATARDMGLFVSISDLSKDWTQPDITSSLKVERNIRGSFKLTQKAVLISSYNGLKPSIVDASEEAPVWIHPHIMILIPKDNIDMGFLCMTLAKQKVPTFGSAQQYIPKTYLLRLEITYPTLDVQKSIYKEACYAYKLSQAKEIGLLEIIEQMKKDYINEVRERKHDMKTPLGQLKSTLTLIEYMAKSLPKESAEQLLKYVEKQKKAMGTLEELVSHIADEDHFAKPEVLNVEELLKGYVEKTDKYVIDYHCDKLSLSEAGIEVPQVKMGKLDFLRLAGNIVSNAIQRGFTKNYPEYALNITLSVNGDFFVIDFSNNGEPLPNGMDKERYGTKGAKGVDSNGTGTGGYIVKSITRHYGGDYDVHSIKLMGMNFTNIIVKLPIYRGEDE